MIVGNDVSAIGQGQIDFDTYKNNSNFVLVKASEGSAFADPQLSRNQSEARRVGMALGYYHFARPSYGNSPQAEADKFLAVIGQLKDGEVLALDYEDNYSGDAVAWCKAWLDYVTAKTGCKPLIYMDQSEVQKYNWKPVSDAGYGLWIASYTYDPTKNTAIIGSWSFAAMQQWTNKQSVPGISKITDGDVFFGDVPTFKKYGYKTPAPNPVPTDWEAKYNTLNGQFNDYKKQFNQDTQNAAVKSATDPLNTRIGSIKTFVASA